jgi:hypothetical protein
VYLAAPSPERDGMAILPQHVANAALARTQYLATSNAAADRADWLFAMRDARRTVADALRASRYLHAIEDALIADASHCLALRHMIAPPKSQDQFKLICSSFSKASENNGRPLLPPIAAAVAREIRQRLDPSILTWLSAGRAPNRKELESLLTRVPPLIAIQRLTTARRNRLALDQETAVIDMLIADGWTKLPSQQIDVRAAVPRKSFMHKTRFATRTQPQEVDIACGLRGTYVLAMECKVTNDQTNSVKRINDVVKKATAWRAHWGSFVETAALLQGVIHARDVQRLTDAGVEVFWSHDIPALRAWLNARI